MTRTFCFWGDKRPIAKEIEGTICWYRVPSTLVPYVHYLGDRSGIVDSIGNDWTGDEFWDYTGQHWWDLSKVNPKVLVDPKVFS